MFMWESFASKRRGLSREFVSHRHLYTHTGTVTHRTKLLSCPQITFLKPCLLVLGSF